jgi:hypothetical protein
MDVLAAVSPYKSALIPGITFSGPFGMDDPDFLTSTVEDDGVGSSMTDYADSSQTLWICPVTKAVPDLGVP